MSSALLKRAKKLEAEGKKYFNPMTRRILICDENKIDSLTADENEILVVIKTYD